MKRRNFLLSCTAAVIAPTVPLKGASVMLGHKLTNKIYLGRRQVYLDGKPIGVHGFSMIINPPA